MHIVLVNPEIPQNTGNIARTCALTGTSLHLVKPLGFSLEDRYLKRAGLDYWDKLSLWVWDDFGSLVKTYPGAVFHLATTKADRRYTDVHYQCQDFLVFGCETRGLPDEILADYSNHQIRVPMLDFGRSLNLSNTVAIILYRALEQMGFPGMD